MAARPMHFVLPARLQLGRNHHGYKSGSQKQKIGVENCRKRFPTESEVDFILLDHFSF
jgi:hypothetical protein